MMSTRLESDVAEHARMTIKLSRAHGKNGDYPAATDCLVGLQRDHEVTDRWPRLIICQNLAAFHARHGHLELAAAHLSEASKIQKGSEDRTARFRFELVSSDIWRLRGDHDSTERALLSAQTGFSSMGLKYDQAICAHGLADLYAEVGERERALERLAEALEVFKSLRITRRVQRVRALEARLAAA